MTDSQAGFLALLLVVSPVVEGAEENPGTDPGSRPPLAEIIVTAQRREESVLGHAGNIQGLDRDQIQAVGAQHVADLMNRVAGAWIVRGSGQEHRTAIRSPALSGAGSCGGFLFMEEGIPIRPSGFCNVNQTIELFTEQARRLEVVRGPGNALYGANALHGVVNVLMPNPGDPAGFALAYGDHHYVRAQAALPLDRDADWHAVALAVHDDGFREHSGFEQGKLHVRRVGGLAGGDLMLAFTATWLDQDTAGFISGFEAYRDEALSRMNFDPDAFREDDSQRLYGVWRRSVGDLDLDIRPFVRHSDSEFMHHFQPGQPVERNGQVSAGALTSAVRQGENHQLTLGADLEWADIFVDEFQSGPATGPPPQAATRPPGQHYDYAVTQVSIAPFVQAEWYVGEHWTFGAGLRYEWIHYDYDNRMLDGNTRDDGTPCGFGGCLFTRPADRSDDFGNLAPKLSAGYRLDERSLLYASLARGFRAPQMTELYRLQNGQQVSDLDSEQLDSLEVGWRTDQVNWGADLSVYAMRKRDSVFRDAEGFNVSGARTRHQGIEASLTWRFAERWEALVDATVARHRYDFTFTPPRGEQFVEGRDVAQAPHWLGSVRLRYAPVDEVDVELQWVHLDDYWLDAANRFRYSGHDLLNLRVGWSLNDRSRLVLRLNNLADRRFADRAEFARGDYRYLPGRGRKAFLEWRYSP